MGFCPPHTYTHTHTLTDAHTSLLLKPHKNFFLSGKKKTYWSCALPFDRVPFSSVIMEFSPGFSSAYSSFGVITDEKVKDVFFLLSFLSSVRLFPVCIQRSSNHCIPIRDTSERLSAGVLWPSTMAAFCWRYSNEPGGQRWEVFNRYKLFLLDN